MKNIILIFFFVVCNITISQTQFLQDGVIVPRNISFNNNVLELNGFGTRSKLFIDVYVQALYVSRLSQNAKEIRDGNELMAIRIQILSDLVTSNKLSKALSKGLKKSVGDQNVFKIEKQVNELETLLNLEPTLKNDFFNLIYNPLDESLHIIKNEKFRGKIKGFEFKKAFFGIWLSDNPVDKDLKEELLGKYK